MRNFDQELKQLLSAEDEQFITETLEDTGFYSEVFGSFRGSSKGLYIMTWAGILVFCVVLFFAIWQFFQVDTVRGQIMYAGLAVMANTAQVSLKLWFNMRLNRREIIREIKRLQLAMAKA